jgi:CO/xanthine dehydrogenase Mo-binding subunit
VELRRMNLVQDDERYITTQALGPVYVGKTMDMALEASGYYQKKGKMGPNRGIGMANSMLNSGFLASSAFVRLNEDGTVTVITSVTDLGTGNLTALCQIAADSIGVSMEDVGLAAQDSAVSPYDTGSIASRTVFDAGNAVRKASLDVREQVAKIAARRLECEPEDIVIQNGVIFDKSQPNVTKTVAEVAFEATFLDAQGPILGRGAIIINPPYDHHVGEGFSERPCGAFTYATHVVEVEVDPETGKVQVLNYTACHDVGKVIHPAGIEGQVEGGVVQGIGFGLYEEILVKDGKIQNPTFVDYRLPTALDTSFNIKSLFLEIPEDKGPFGAKGIGEPTMIPPPPALANAILDAIGVHVTETPITPERLFWSIQEQMKSEKKTAISE